MTYKQALKQRERILRESQQDLCRRLQDTLNDLSGATLDTQEWITDLVDRHLEDLLEEIRDHFGNTRDEEDAA